MSPKFTEYLITKKEFTPHFRMDNSGNYLVPTMVLVPKDKKLNSEVKLTGKPFGRFLGFNNIGRRRFLANCYTTEKVTSRSGREYVKKNFIGTDKANDWIVKSYEEIPTEKFKLLDVDGRVARITSDAYIGIPHTFVQDVIEKRLKAEGFEFVKKINTSGQIGEYDIVTEGSISKQVAIERAKEASRNGGSVQQELGSMVRYFNSNSGDKSLKLFGGVKVLVCANGMISTKDKGGIRLLHKLDMPIVRRRIEETLSKILENLKPLQKKMLSLRDITVTKEQAKEFVESLPIPKYMQKAVWDRLFTKSQHTRNGDMDWDGSLWGIYMASTYIASHYDKVTKGRKDKEIDDEQRQKLATFETFTTAWDAREKELENTNAKKVEVKKK